MTRALRSSLTRRGRGHGRRHTLVNITFRSLCGGCSLPTDRADTHAFYEVRLKSNDCFSLGRARAFVHAAAVTAAVFIHLAPVASGVVNYAQIPGLAAADGCGRYSSIAAEWINNL